ASLADLQAQIFCIVIKHLHTACNQLLHNWECRIDMSVCRYIHENNLCHSSILVHTKSSRPLTDGLAKAKSRQDWNLVKHAELPGRDRLLFRDGEFKGAFWLERAVNIDTGANFVQKHLTALALRCTKNFIRACVCFAQWFGKEFPEDATIQVVG